MPSSSLISIVDDDDSVRESLSGLIRSVGFRVMVFASAEEFLNSNHFSDTDCLILDVRMPGMNGLDTIRSAVSQRPSLHALLMTGYADEEAVAEARDRVPVIRKPIDLDELMRRIA